MTARRAMRRQRLNGAAQVRQRATLCPNRRHKRVEHGRHRMGMLVAIHAQSIFHLRKRFQITSNLRLALALELATELPALRAFRQL